MQSVNTVISQNINILRKRLDRVIQKELIMFEKQLQEILNSPEQTPEPVVEPEMEPEQTPEPVVEPEMEPEQIPEPEQVAEPEQTPEPEMEPEQTPKKSEKPKKSKCPFILKSGKNKGEACGKNAKDSEDFCSKHIKKSPSDDANLIPTMQQDQILQNITIDGKTVLTDGVSVYQEIDDSFVEIGHLNNGVITYLN